MASALGDFDQSMKLIVSGIGFNLKLYFNFFHMPLFVSLRMYRRSTQLDFANARGHSKRHQQTSTERAQERRNRIRRGRIFSRQPPSQRSVFHFGVQRFADRFDRDVAMMMRPILR